MIIDSPIISGSLMLSGSTSNVGNITITGSLLTSSGSSVGIGFPNPTSSLNINGNVSIGSNLTPLMLPHGLDTNGRALIIAGSGSANPNYGVLFLANNSTFESETTLGGILASQVITGSKSGTNAATKASIAFYSTGSGGSIGGLGGYINFSTRPNNAANDIGSYERMRIDTNGNVGIGTTSPISTLHVAGSTTVKVSTATNNLLLTVSAASPTYNLIGLNGSAAEGVWMGFAGGGGSDKDLYINAGNAGAIRFRNGDGSVSVQKGMFTSSTSRFEFLVGTSTAIFTEPNRSVIELNGSTNCVYGLEVNGSPSGYLYHNGTNQYLHTYTGNLYLDAVSAGVYLSSNATSWTANSDIRLKNINSNIENAVESLSTLRTVKYSWKSDETNKEHLGLIAQDVEQQFPQVIDRSKLNSGLNEQSDNTEYLGVRYQELIPVLVKAIQELKSQNDALQARIETLEQK